MCDKSDGGNLPFLPFCSIKTAERSFAKKILTIENIVPFFPSKTSPPMYTYHKDIVSDLEVDFGE